MSSEIIREAEQTIRNEQRLLAWRVKYMIHRLMESRGDRRTIRAVEVVAD